MAHKLDYIMPYMNYFSTICTNYNEYNIRYSKWTLISNVLNSKLHYVPAMEFKLN